MPPIIKKQIKKIRKEERFSGYIKLVPLLFFVGFLFVGWLVSLTASKFFKTDYGIGGFAVGKIPITFAEDDCGSACGGCSSGDGTGPDSGGGSGGGDSGGSGDSGSGSSGSSGSAGSSGCGNDGVPACGEGSNETFSCACGVTIEWPCGNVNAPNCPQ